MSSTRHLLRPGMRALLACLPLVLPAVSLAQSSSTPDGGLPPIDIPDASVGGGCADCEGEEDEPGVGRVNTVCRSTRDCSARFTCQNGTCRYTGVRQAERVGCLLGPEAALLLVGLAAVAVPRRKKQ